MAGSGLPPMTILILLLAAFIVLGCLMDSLSMILLAIPFFGAELVRVAVLVAFPALTLWLSAMLAG